MSTAETLNSTNWLTDAMLDLVPGQRVSATDIPWAVYTRLADLRDDRRSGVKITFDRGRIEIMSPKYQHEKPHLRLSLIVMALVEELGLEMVAARSTTFRNEQAEQGLEPDDCFYIAHALAVIGLEDLDLSVVPPPDLAIEVDSTHSSVPKDNIYAEMGVPELWRHDDDAVTILILQPDRSYRASTQSKVLPQLTADAMTELLLKTNSLGDIGAMRRFRAWIKANVMPTTP